MATSFAQAGRSVNALGTTHADYFYGAVPCTRAMTSEEIQGDYEVETGKVIVEAFKGINPLDIPAVLVKEHGPFTWGKDPKEAVYHSVVLEEVSKMAFNTALLSGHGDTRMQRELLDKHYLRKHGKDAYYGQK
ncbi:MAG: L-ribulose-5-phosphate 4-epimerase [Clostridia bacterium]|nr:L-ribulose-5-phosphate 4-epimerase [Clostridia bacterium]